MGQNGAYQLGLFTCKSEIIFCVMKFRMQSDLFCGCWNIYTNLVNCGTYWNAGAITANKMLCRIIRFKLIRVDAHYILTQLWRNCPHSDCNHTWCWTSQKHLGRCEVLKVVSSLPIHFYGQFCCRIYRSATTESGKNEWPKFPHLA